MLLPALGHPRLAREQGAEVLISDPLWRNREQQRGNAYRRGKLPPTHKRNCSPFAQRNTTKFHHRLAAKWQQCDQFFYGPINLAKVLTAPE
jgi:hypothetical protein